MNITELYAEWGENWELSNPPPKPSGRDIILSVLQITVAIGAVVLSGSRTGNAVARIGALADFGSRIAYLGLGREIFLSFEALLAFMTFDAGILLAGYLTGDKKAGVSWYWVLLVASMIPALSANVLPGVEIVNADWGETGRAATDIIIGIFTPFMAFVAGRVIGAAERQRKSGIADELKEWEDRKGRAWLRHYNRYVKPKQPKQIVAEKQSVEVDYSSMILSYVNGGGEKTIDEIADSVGLDRVPAMVIVNRLVNDGRLIEDRMRYRATDF